MILHRQTCHRELIGSLADNAIDVSGERLPSGLEDRGVCAARHADGDSFAVETIQPTGERVSAAKARGAAGDRS